MKKWNDSLFERNPDPEFEYARRGTPNITFLNRSPRKVVQDVCDELDKWFLRIPTAEKQRLQSDFRSLENRVHLAGFFELFCHELLLNHGYDVAFHRPDKSGRAKDFRCSKNGNEIDVEATISTDEDRLKEQNSLETQLLDFIDKHAFVPGWRYWIKKITLGQHLPPLKQLVKNMKKWACTSDEAEPRSKNRNLAKEDISFKSFSGDDWEIVVGLMPHHSSKTLNEKRKPRHCTMGPVRTRSPQDDKSLRNTLKTKARRYKDHPRPYLVAINTWHQSRQVDDIDVYQALLGTEVTRYSFSGLLEMPKTSFEREPDGFWIGPNGPRNRHVSGILLFNSVMPWSVNVSDPVLYLHPYANHAIKKQDFLFDSVTWNTKTGEHVKERGSPLHDIMGLPPDWLDESEAE